MAKEADTSDSRKYGVSAGVNINIPGVDSTARQLADLTKQVEGLQKALSNLSSSSNAIGNNISGMLNKVTSAASAASNAAGQGGGGGASAGGGGSTYANGGGSIVKSMFGTVNANGWVRDLALFPQRFMTDQIQNNRNLAQGMSTGLGMQSFASGARTSTMMGMLAGNYGNVLGSPQDLLSMAQIGSRVGAGINWNAQGPNAPGQWNLGGGPRMGGFYRGVMEAQRMNPGAPVEQLAGTIGGYSANVGAQQQGTFLTGGAFSMIARGNRQKSVSEWAEGILNFLKSQRPGAKRGQPFTYGELMTQNFPGSNIDAWLSQNGVPEGMKEYFWTYAMAKSNAGGTDIFGKDYAPTQSNVSYQRLQAGNAETRSGLQLASKLSGTYANKEQANRWMNELMGSMLNQILPSALSSTALSYMQYLPDMMQEMLQQLGERTTIGAMGSAALGWGSLFPGIFSTDTLSGAMGGLGSGMDAIKGLFGGDTGDVGDVGDYGPMGGTSTAGMHPDARKRVDAMMRANPKLKMNSGLRDLGTQQRLRRKGVGRVSGKPSAHTRGMAADLGPASQYPWIMANAGKFGLHSGAGHGEPWHVGMGDPEGVGDPASAVKGLMQIFGQWGSLFNSNDPEAQISGVAGGTTAILKMLMAAFGGGEENAQQLEQRNVYEQLSQVTQQALRKGLVFEPLPSAGATTGGTGAGPFGQTAGAAGAGAQSTSTGYVKNIRANTVEYGFTAPGGGDFLSNDPVQRAVATANSAYRAGFRGNDLFKILSIAGRETTWRNLHAYVPSTGDDSWGLTMINMLGSMGPARRQQYGLASNDDLLNPDIAMRVTKQMVDASGKMGGFYAWGPYKGKSEMYDTEDMEQGVARQALDIAFPNGYGDIDYASPSPASIRSSNYSFNNTFVLGGGSSGGAGGGIDVRRAASQIADQLETQMRQRMSRSN